MTIENETQPNATETHTPDTTPGPSTGVSDVPTAQQGETMAPSSSSASADDPLNEARFQKELEDGKYGDYIKEGASLDDGSSFDDDLSGEGTPPETDKTSDTDFDAQYEARYNTDPLVLEAKEATTFLESIGSNLVSAKEAAITGAALNNGDYDTFSERVIPSLSEFALNAPTEIIEKTLRDAATIFALRTGNYQAVPELEQLVASGLSPEAASEQAQRMAEQKSTEAKLEKLEKEKEQLEHSAQIRQQVEAIGNVYNGFLQQQQKSDPEMYTEVEQRFVEVVRADQTPTSAFQTAEALSGHLTMLWKSIEADVLREKVSEDSISQMDPLKTRTRTSVPDLPSGPVGSHPMDSVVDPKFGF